MRMASRWGLVIVTIAIFVACGWYFLAPRKVAVEPSSSNSSQPKEDPAPATRPNVVLISLDTTRADHLGCFGYNKPTTPNLDRWAKRGVQFRNCRSQAPWTLPSHMSLFTSLTPARHGVDNLNMTLPPDIPTLAELLQDAGYHTAGLVNDGQMKKHWGFNRGFDTWREFEVDTPVGSCEHITSQALAWLAKAPRDKPYFLFLHYYDTHDPYEAPDEFRKRMGTTLTGKEARELCFHYRTPDTKMDRPELLKQLVAAYDAELAWLDSQLERLFAELPKDTLVVIFGDHGESFKEHGWMLHGTTLFDEETHVPLLIRLPNDSAAGTVSEESVMLLDVSPTILAQCGVRAPRMQQGDDLSALWRPDAAVWSPRIVPAETKAVLEGQLLHSATLFPLKGIYSVLDARYDVFRLPDEQHPLNDVAARQAMEGPLRELVGEEQFWLLQATGKGDFSASLTLNSGSFGLFIPAGLDPERDSFTVSPDGKTINWQVYPRGLERVLTLLFKPTDSTAKITCDFQHNGERLPGQVFLGDDGKHPKEVPAVVEVSTMGSPLNPWQQRPFKPKEEGFYLRYFQGAQSSGKSGDRKPLDEATIRQLESLGYLRNTKP